MITRVKTILLFCIIANYILIPSFSRAGSLTEYQKYVRDLGDEVKKEVNHSKNQDEMTYLESFDVITSTIKNSNGNVELLKDSIDTLSDIYESWMDRFDYSFSFSYQINSKKYFLIPFAELFLVVDKEIANSKLKNEIIEEALDAIEDGYKTQTYLKKYIKHKSEVIEIIKPICDNSISNQVVDKCLKLMSEL